MKLILWTIAAIVAVAYIAGLVSKMQDESQWSHVVPPPASTTVVCAGHGCVAK